MRIFIRLHTTEGLTFVCTWTCLYIFTGAELNSRKDSSLLGLVASSANSSPNDNLTSIELSKVECSMSSIHQSVVHRIETRISSNKLQSLTHFRN